MKHCKTAGRGVIVVAWAALSAAVWGADDPGVRTLQQQQLQRQQQQEALQLRMQQQQRAVQSPPGDSRQKQAQEKLQADQQLQQQQLHYRQAVEPAIAHPTEDEGARRARAERERLDAQRQSQQHLRRSDQEMQQGGIKLDEAGTGVPVPPHQLKIAPDAASGR